MPDNDYFKTKDETPYKSDLDTDKPDTDADSNDKFNGLYLDEIALGKLATYDASVYALQNLFDNLEGFGSARLSGIDIDPVIIKNAFDKKKGPKVEEHINSGKLQITPETRALIWIRGIILQSQRLTRNKFLKMLSDETAKRRDQETDPAD